MKNDVNFLYEVGCLRFIKRAGSQFMMPNLENLSEHIFRVTWIALTLAKHEEQTGAKINYEKLMKMALVHDLEESRTGDSNFLAAQYSKQDSARAISDVLSNTALSDMVEVWHEYEKRDCIEAKIVKDSDALDCDLSFQEMRAQGTKLPEDWGIRRYVFENKLFTESAKKMWLQIQDSDPFDWNQNILNKFTAKK